MSNTHSEDDEPTRLEVYQQQGKSVARYIRDMTMIELNYLTVALMKYGIAASFNQYIPEIHDNEIAAPQEGDPSLDNAFGGRDPG